MRWIVVVICALGFCAIAACDEPTPYSRPKACNPNGVRSELTVGVDGGARPSIEEPILCADNASYVVLVHGFGRRRLDRTLLNKQHDPDDPCEKPLADAPLDAGGCRPFAFGAFADLVSQRLFDRLGPERIYGHDGTCNVALNMPTLASGVPMLRYWSNADEAVRMIDEELERYDIRDDFPLVVAGASCKSLL